MTSMRPSKEQVRSSVSEYMSEQYARSQSEADPRDGLDLLHGLLADAAKAYETGPGNQRQAVCDAIKASTDFLQAQGVDFR